MTDPKEILILDTHIWIWLLTGDKQLENSKYLPRIENAMKHSHIRISAISIWEVGMLEMKGRIKFSLDCMAWVNKAISIPGLSLIPLTPEIAIESSRLPGKFHGDPADRIIVASARKENAILITHDRSIISYGKENYVKVMSM